jgi:hypothetical protein
LAPLSLRLASAPRLTGLVFSALLACTAGPSRADAGWFASGDTQLRMDLQLLNDANVIQLPISYWPLPRAAVRYALARARAHVATNSSVADALERVRARIGETEASGPTFDTGIRGGQPGLWRNFDTLAREDGELSAGFDYAQGRFSVGIQATAVTNPDDGDALRLDGSQATVQLGNWLLSAHEMDRWWGPGHEGSLILSNNARPMPTLMVERAEAREFGTKWLSWIGPWRMSFGLSQMETNRQDIDSPLFMAWRVVIMPIHNMEFGFSRTAQFCGQELNCNPTIFKNLIVGNDNVGRTVSAKDEPGNQMAGYDLHWTSPLGHLPYAIYGQYIGEDVSGYLPAKFISQLGAEIWHPIAGGGIFQWFLEWSNTECTGKHGTVKTCAYNQGRFSLEGYRYHGRTMGLTSDRDADNWALGSIYTAPGGDLWTATARASKLSRDAVGDTNNTVASLPTRYDAIEFGWKGRLFGQPVSADLGFQSVEPLDATRQTELYGFIGWHYQFQP